MGIASTPEPPYTAVIFTSIRTDRAGYEAVAATVMELAAAQAGFIDFENARTELGIAVSYWHTRESAEAWSRFVERTVASVDGEESWFRDYRVRIATVEREYGDPRD